MAEYAPNTWSSWIKGHNSPTITTQTPPVNSRVYILSWTTTMSTFTKAKITWNNFGIVNSWFYTRLHVFPRYTCIYRVLWNSVQLVRKVVLWTNSDQCDKRTFFHASEWIYIVALTFQWMLYPILMIITMIKLHNISMF